jgi:hypothetical protein
MARAKVSMAGMPLYLNIARYKPEVIKMGKATATDTRAINITAPDNDTKWPKRR